MGFLTVLDATMAQLAPLNALLSSTQVIPMDGNARAEVKRIARDETAGLTSGGWK